MPRTGARRGRGVLYPALAFLMTAIVVGGFWRSYFGPMLRGDVARTWVIQVHGVVYVGWMLLLVAQVALVATAQTHAHRRVGRFGIWYGFLVLAMGLIVSFAAPLQHLAGGDWDLERAAGFLIIPLGDMVLFAGFFTAAVVYRNQPQLHKRLMVLATVSLLFAAVGRVSDLLSLPFLVLVWVSPVLAGLAHEIITRRRLDRVYAFGLVALIIGSMRLTLQQSELWLAFARPLLRRMM